MGTIPNLPATVTFAEGNRVKYGQNFGFFRGVPAGVAFSVRDMGDWWLELRADGYGHLKSRGDAGKYGNGCIIVAKHDMPGLVPIRVDGVDTHRWVGGSEP